MSTLGGPNVKSHKPKQINVDSDLGSRPQRHFSWGNVERTHFHATKLETRYSDAGKLRSSISRMVHRTTPDHHESTHSLRADYIDKRPRVLRSGANIPSLPKAVEKN
jgi:hypothetical protein